ESEDRARTRERFNEVFTKYTELEKKRLKKKRHETQETIVLQNRNPDKDIENDEVTILQNIRDHEQSSPGYIKSKERERKIAEKANINGGNQEEIQASKGKKKNKRELPPLPVPKENTSFIQKDAAVPKSEIAVKPGDVGGGGDSKRKTTKGKSKGDTEAKAERQVEDTDDTLLHEYQQQIAHEEARTLKKTKVKTEEESVVTQNVALTNDAVRKKKKKLKKEESEAEAEAPPTFDDSLVLGVYIHRADLLKANMLISHPMVKVHVVDEITGQYVKKENHRPVSSFYEQENVDHILPIMTQPFDFKKNKSVIPEWEEQIIFNERFGYFVQQDDESPRVILFFEILDFITMEEARAKADVDKHEQGFRKIAWAFLKLVGTNGVLNIDSKLRLQLFCPLPRAKRQPKTTEVVEWWRKYPRHKYAATLYVTVKGIKLPDQLQVDPSIRSMMALQEERGSTSYTDLQSEVTKRSLTQHPDSKPPVLRWSRLPGQVCRIPNKPILAFRGGQMGCYTVLFSHAGMILAAACADRDAFPVVYEIPSGKVLTAFSGHLKIVYDLCWSRDDRSLLSASSDGTVEWNVDRLLGTAQKVLPHPCFVYCAQYHPSAQNLVVTGGYDSLVRVWRLDVDDVNGQLLQDFEGHSGFINTVCFDSERRMFSADNTGLIIVWKTSVTDSRRQQQPCHHWCIEKKIDESDLRGIPINMLRLHPNNRCLLIHAKDSVLRMMDLRLAVKKYTGATNYRERIYSTFTPCGNFIFSGSEDGMAYVWNTDTDQVAVYSELCYPTALHGVSFHPHENMVAFCTFGQSQPVHVYLYDHKSQLEVHSIKAASTSASADTKTGGNTPNPFVLQDTSSVLTMDQFAQTTRLALKMQRVKQQLDSALNSSLPPPSLLSPHSRLQLSGSLAEQLISQAALHVETGSAPLQQVVVSLYDYRANRSDELTIRRGDVIQVLYKDNDSWWFGRLVNGQQGYFLASYVVDQFSEEVTQSREVHTALSEDTVERSTPTR
uniref:SH3 domain-containing protein n=1 Tax=Monopterus albus TaxID=43700 RepID=A0A3Q3KJE7_MONAL